MIRLKTIMEESKVSSVKEATNLLVYNVDPDACETFLRKYPKIRTAMTGIARKAPDLLKGYKAFLKLKDGNEATLGGKKEVVSSPTFGEKVLYRYDWSGVGGGWPEVYQYIHGQQIVGKPR